MIPDRDMIDKLKKILELKSDQELADYLKALNNMPTKQLLQLKRTLNHK